MKNKIYIDGLLVVQIIKTKNRMFLVTEDGKEHKARGLKVQFKCSICGNLSNPITFFSRNENKYYKCKSCILKERISIFGPVDWTKGKNPDEVKEIYRKRSEKRKTRTCEQIAKESENKSKAAKSLWQNYDFRRKHVDYMTGSNNPMYGKNIKDYMSPEKYEEWKNNISTTFKNKSQEEKSIISKKISDNQKIQKETDPLYYQKKKKAGSSSTRKQGKYKINAIEKIVENYLRNNNVIYDYSCIMGSGENCFQYDFIIRKQRILIEVQGDYWHGNPKFFNNTGSDGKRKLNQIQIKKIERDRLKYNFAKEKNFEIVYIWEDEIKHGDFSKLEFLKEPNND